MAAFKLYLITEYYMQYHDNVPLYGFSKGQKFIRARIRIIKQITNVA